jgi:hypothetical protein
MRRMIMERIYRLIPFIPIAGLIVACMGMPHFSAMVRCGLAVVSGSAAALVFVVFDRWIEKRCDADQKRRLLISALYGSILFLVPFAMRAEKGSWENVVFDLTCYAGCVCFLAFGLAARVAPFIAPSEKIRRFAGILFPAALVTYGIVLGWHGIQQYNAYFIEWADFAFEFPPFWQSLRFHPFRMIDVLSYETNMLSFHWPLVYLPLAPITFLWNDPRVTIVAYTLFFMAAGWTVYLLAHRHTKSRTVAAWAGTVFLLYLPVHCAYLSGLHADPLAMPFIFMSFYFAEAKAWKRYWIVVGLALICKEYVGLVYLGYGLYLSLKNRRMGVATAVVGLAGFLFVIKAGIPWFNRGEHPWVLNMNYGTIGGDGGMLSMALYCLEHPGQFAAVLFRPQNIVAFVSMLLPFCFLPAARPLVLAAGSLIVLKNALSASGIELLVHRETLFIPFVVYALIRFIGSIPPGGRRAFYCLAIMVSVSVTYLAQGHAFPSRGFLAEQGRYRVTDHERAIDDLVSMVPPDAPVMASSHITPRLMMRKWYFLFPFFPAPVEPEYCIVDTIGQREQDWYPLQMQRDSLKQIIEENRYSIMARKHGVLLLRRTGRGER